MPSYSPVFSSQFILNNSTTGYSSFEVPAGFTAVIRDFSCYTIVGVSLAQILVQNSSVAPPIVVASLGELGVNVYAQWQGRVVVPAGGLIDQNLEFTGDGPDTYVGGYLLRNTLT